MIWFLVIAGLIAMLDITGFKADEETINVIYSQDGEGEQNSTSEPKSESQPKASKPVEKKEKEEVKETDNDIRKPHKQQRIKTEAVDDFIEIEVDDEDSIRSDAFDALNNIY